MKRKILVPVDFSEESHNAYLYAREMVKAFNCIIEVIHAFKISYTGNTAIELTAELGKVKSIEKELKLFIENYPKEEEGTVLTKVEVVTTLKEGNPGIFVAKESEKEGVFMVIMGTTGKHLLGDYMFGSVASSVAQNASCPVLLIPKNVAYVPFEDILYASSFESAEPEMITEITNFANLFRAAVHFIHIEKKGKEGDFSKVQKTIFEQLFKDGDLAFAFHMQSVPADSIVNGLHDYADKNGIDLIVLVNKKRDFFNSLMGNSTSKNMALDIKYPIMIYHYASFK